MPAIIPGIHTPFQLPSKETLTARFKRYSKSLTWQVLAAIVIGVILGQFFPETGKAFKPLGDGFIKLIKVVVAPIIFLTIVVGMAGMGDVKKVGRVGVKAIIYFEIVTTLALVFGMVLVNVVRPGEGFDISHIAAVDISKYTVAAAEQEDHGMVSFLLAIIPESFLSGFAQGNLIQVLFVSVLFGWALSTMGPANRPVLDLFERVSQVFFGMIKALMYLAPIGAFGAMAFTVGKYGIDSLWPLSKLVLLTAVSMVLFVVIVLGAVSKIYRFNLWRFLRYIENELVIVFGTASSETVLPRMMQKLERLGCEKSVVGLVVPTGYSFNLDGSTLYLSMSALFLAQAFNIPMDLWQQLGLLGIMLVTSKGAAGVSGSGFIVLAATIQASGTIPVESVALLLGIDRFMSSIRAMTNLVGNGVATLAVSRMEKVLDDEKAVEEYRTFFDDQTIQKI